MARITTGFKRPRDLMTANMYNDIVESINILYDRSESNKGLYDDASKLPEGKNGDFAMVLTGGAFPATIYRHDGVAWSPTSNTWSPTEPIDLANYPTKAEMEASIEEHAIETADNLTTETTGKALDARQGFVLAGQIGELRTEMAEIKGGDITLTGIYHSGYIYNGNVAGTGVGYWYSASGWSSYIFDVTELAGQSIKVTGVYRAQSYRYIFCRDYATLPASESAYNEDPTKWTDNIISVNSGSGSSGNNEYVNNNLTVPSLPDNAEHIYLVLAQYSDYKASATYTKESAYQEKLTFDNAPTEGSKNPVTSGGVKNAITPIENNVADLQERIVDYDGSLDTDKTASSQHVTINDGIAAKLINANGNYDNRGFWNAFTNGRSWIFDVTDEVGKSINITYWKRANSRAYVFVPDVALIPSSDPGAENWPSLYIKLGSKSYSTVYEPETVTDIVPQPVTAAGEACEKVYLIVSGYWVGAESESNIVPKAVVPENAYVAIPKKTSQLENDSGFITTEQGTGIMALNPKKDYLLRVKNMVHHFYGGTHEVTPLLLAHFSDIHGNGTALARMLEWCGEFDTYIDDIIHTGDCVTGKYSDGLAFWDNVEDSEKILNITGNHDYSTTGDGSGGMSAADVYQLLFVGDDSENPRIANWGVVQPDGAGTVNYNAWYKDYTSKKVRLIGIDCMKRNAEQLAWLKTTLADAANKGLTVAIAFHSSPLNTNSELVKCPFTGMYNGSMGAYSWASAVTAVDDFKAGTLEGQEQAGDFACWLGGHSHKDTVYWVNGTQLSIVVDSMTTGISGRNRLVSTDDKSQDCFNLVAIDTYWKTIKLLRVGNDTDDQLRKIDQCAIKYTTGEVL